MQQPAVRMRFVVGCQALRRAHTVCHFLHACMSHPADAGMLVCPESPAWLVLKGHRREAGAVAEKLWGADGSSQLGAGACGAGAPPARAGAAHARCGLQAATARSQANAQSQLCLHPLSASTALLSPRPRASCSPRPRLQPSTRRGLPARRAPRGGRCCPARRPSWACSCLCSSSLAASTPSSTSRPRVID